MFHLISHIYCFICLIVIFKFNICLLSIGVKLWNRPCVVWTVAVVRYCEGRSTCARHAHLETTVFAPGVAMQMFNIHRLELYTSGRALPPVPETCGRGPGRGRGRGPSIRVADLQPGAQQGGRLPPLCTSSLLKVPQLA